MKRIDIKIGSKYNMLTVLEELPISKNCRRFKCVCDCGNVKDVLMSHLIRSLIKSCGCYRISIKTKHGLHNSREYSSWENMIQRCTNPKARKYNIYGGRGITVCSRWKESFINFFEDMGIRPENTSLDRINNEEGYYKENCRWSTVKEQLVNVRSFNQYIKHDGVLKTIEDWLTLLNINREIFKSRVLRGMDFKTSLLCSYTYSVNIIVLNISDNSESIYSVENFLEQTKFDEKTVFHLLDTDHEEPYSNYIIRYLIGFNGWPIKYI